MRRNAVNIAEAREWIEGERQADWPDPIALPSGLPDVMPFKAEMLPAPFAPWVADIAVGWLIGLVGMTMLLTGVIRRGRAARAARTAALAARVAPAGWFADPLGEHRLRYWNGEQWTDHVAN